MTSSARPFRAAKGICSVWATVPPCADRRALSRPQQIQRWEATDYAGIGVERMQA